MMRTVPDPYERRYMDADVAVARSRARMKWWTHLAFAALALFTAYTVWHTHGWSSVAAAVLAAMTLAIWATHMVVRVTVTRAHVHIQHGLFGPTIALGEIVEVRIEDSTWSKWLKYVGWGVGGRGLDGSYGYTIPGVPRGLALRFRHAGGTRTAFVSSDDPEALRDSIEAVRRQVRIAEGVAGAAPRAAGEGHAEEDAAEPRTGRHVDDGSSATFGVDPGEPSALIPPERSISSVRKSG